MPASAAASDGPTVSLSFANNFWGKDDAGVVPLLDRMQGAKVTGDELRNYYNQRASIEENYAKDLLKLARKSLGSLEIGTLRLSLDVVKAETESMAKAHHTIAAQMRSELEEPLVAFTGGIKERRKIVQNGVEKVLKLKNQQTAVVNKTRDRFEQDCLKIKGYLAQGHMVMGQEERKNKAKLEKTQTQMSSNSDEYEAAVKVLEETTGRWNREWKAACDKFQDLEEERLDFFKSSLWSFANIASTVCVSDDQSCEKVRLSLEDCEVEKDVINFISSCGTGQEIPDPPKYINFCRGDIEDTASNHESDDGNYSVAQFQRTMNPTFRTASPQPSTFESHHDPDSSLREEMGIPKTRTSLQADDAFHASARSSQGSVANPPLVPAQMPPQANPYNEVPQIPSQSHIPRNPYAADNMSQYGRMDPHSDREMGTSPARPDSRDSQERSDYSAPTSFSSFEPSSGQVSPTKNYNGSNVSAVSSYMSDDKPEEKKKSGFFGSSSPFRRRSQKNRDPPQFSSTISSSTTASSNRNTWAPSAPVSRQPEPVAAAPIKPFSASNRANTWTKQASASPEPDSVDPRADYQLGIGNNVFDVASPDSPQKHGANNNSNLDLDPIAQALAELKGVTKKATIRQSADRHYGMSTPAPGTPAADARGMPAGAVPTPFAKAANRATPPPAYDQPMSRLGAPQPAHTSREMQKTTERFLAQKRDMFNSSAAAAAAAAPARPTSSMGRPKDIPRAVSPVPARAPSPRPFITADKQQQQKQAPQQRPQPSYRAASPKPPAPSMPSSSPASTTAPSRPRATSATPIKQHPPPQQQQQQHTSPYNAYATRNASPGYQVPRAASPNPAYSRPPPSMNTAPAAANSRPPSSRGSDFAGPTSTGGAMALQLAQPSQDSYGSQRGGRPQSQYYASDPQYANSQLAAPRTRSQSVGTQRQYSRDGRPILHHARAMYMYQAAIPEELSFAKGDILAVLLVQDDGWWEAEVVGKNERPGLVPSNYLKIC